VQDAIKKDGKKLFRTRGGGEPEGGLRLWSGHPGRAGKGGLYDVKEKQTEQDKDVGGSRIKREIKTEERPWSTDKILRKGANPSKTQLKRRKDENTRKGMQGGGGTGIPTVV